MRAAVVGAGAVGARAARLLLSAQPDLAELRIVDVDAGRRDSVVASLGAPASGVGDVRRALAGADVVIVASPRGHRAVAEDALERGASVVSTGDALDDVRSLLALDAEARERGRAVVVGAGFAPGLTCLLARHAASGLDSVEEIHVAKAGTGGPACARHHHRALAGDALDWRDGAWQSRPGGSGRELVWFPDPIGGIDCYRGALADALLLVPAFGGVARVTTRMAASRRDRVTSRLPMLRRPHPEGILGAVRVEVRGRRGSAAETVVLGALDRPAVAAGAVAARAASWILDGRLERTGAFGLAAGIPDPVPFLTELADGGVRAAVFEGGG